MKATKFLLTAWLAATALALVPPISRRDAGEPAVIQAEDDYMNLDPILDALDIREEQPYFEDPFAHSNSADAGLNAGLAFVGGTLPPDVTGYNVSVPTKEREAVGAIAAVGTGSDGPAIAGFPSEPKLLNVSVRTGGPREHVGTLRKNRLERAIYECLKRICPLDNPKRGLNPCTPKNTQSCTVDDIVYNAEPHDKYATNSHLTIQVDWAYHNPVWPGIGDAVYRAVASVFRVDTDIGSSVFAGKYYPGSCYPVDFPGSRRTTMCNIFRRASVGFPVNSNHPNGDAGEIQAMAAVAIFFNGKTEEGDYNQEHSEDLYRDLLEKASDDHWLPGFAKSIGRPKEDLRMVYEADKTVGKVCQGWMWFEEGKCKKGD